jgi:hypothetical protein
VEPPSLPGSVLLGSRRNLAGFYSNILPVIWSLFITLSPLGTHGQLGCVGFITVTCILNTRLSRVKEEEEWTKMTARYQV